MCVTGPGSNALFVNTSNGNIGIANSNPQFSLDLSGGMNINGSLSASNMGLYKNRVLNGDMRLDQSLTSTASNVVITGSNVATAAASNAVVDKWQAATGAGPGIVMAQQVALSVADQVAVGGTFNKAVQLSQVPVNELTTYIPFDGYSAADLMGGLGAPVPTGTVSYSTTLSKVGTACLDLTANTSGATTLTTGVTYTIANAPTTAITVGCWLYKPANSTYLVPVFIGSNSSGANIGVAFEFCFDPTGQLYINFVYGGTLYQIFASGIENNAAGAMANNTWTHVCATAAPGSLIKLYVNGALVQSSASVVLSGTVLSCYSESYPVTTVRFGGRNAGYYHAYNGYIDDVRIYNRVLSAAEIAVLAGNIGIPQTPSTTTTDITTYSSRLTFDSTTSDAMSALAAPTAVGGAASYNTTTYKIGNASLDLTSNTPYGTIKSLTYTPGSTSAPMTVSFWINPTSSTSNAYYQIPLCFGSSTATGYDIVLNSSNQLFIESYLGSLASTLPSSDTYIPSGTWSFVVGTLVSGGASSLYVNGTLVASMTVATGTTLTNTGNMIVGRNISVDMNVGYTPVFSVTGHSSGYSWANSTNKPTFDPYNNQVTFAAASSQYLNPGSKTFTMASTGFTASFVVLFTAASGNYYERVYDFCPSPGSVTDSIVITRAGTANQLDAYFWYGSSGISSVVSAPIAQNTLQILTVTISSSGAMTMYKNGSSVATASTTAPTTRTITQPSVGRSSDASPIYSDMRLFYFAAYNATLSSTDVANQHALFASTLFSRINTIPAALSGLTPTSNLYPLTPVIEVTPTMSGASWANSTNRPTFNTTNNYIKFDSASSQYLDAGAKTFNTHTNGFSATAVFMWTAPAGTNGDRIFDFGSGSPNGNIILYRSYFTNFNGTTRTATVNGQPAYVHHKLQFITVTMTAAGVLTVYENGVSVGTGSGSAITGPKTFANTYIGRSLYAGEPYANMNLYYFAAYDGTLTGAQVLTQYQTLSGLIRPEWGQFAYTGLIDDVRLYNTALSASQISGMYTPLSTQLTFDNTTADAQGTLSAPTLTGTLAFSSNCKVGTASLDLTVNPVTGAPNTYLKYLCSAPPSQCTLSFWMYVSSISGSGQQVPVGFGSASQYSWLVAIDNSSSGKIYTNMPMGTVGSSQVDYSTTTTAYAVAGTWMHFVNTVNASTGQNCIYVNGVLVGSRSDIPSSAVFVAQDKTAVTGFKLGGIYHSTTINSFKGLIDDFRLYNSALTPSQVAGLYYSSPNNNGYVLYQQPIEGQNIADLAWGTSGALPATVSAWIKNNSTAQQQLAISLQNGSNNRSYVYTTPSLPANTWSKVSFTVPGDSNGTWASDNTTGLTLGLTLGSANTYNLPTQLVATTSNATVSSWSNYTICSYTNVGSGTFTVSAPGYIDFLVVGGGGGGGCDRAPGGGAGGLIYGTNVPIAAGTYNITVGAGGAGGTNADNAAPNGSNSSFSVWTAYGGGGAGGYYTTGSAGGCGGGGHGQSAGAGGAATIGGQGFAGGAAYASGHYNSGGGGGAGGAGSAANATGGGDGGPGYACSITGTQTYYAGGGGGSKAFDGGFGNTYSGKGGIGGGGNAGQTAGAAGTAGTPNTGGGGGGGANIPSGGAGGNGGSGIVIIRYLTNVSASAWNSAQYLTSSVQVFGQSNAFLNTLGNSLLLTGVQLEKGSLATPYEFRPYAIENMLVANSMTNSVVNAKLATTTAPGAVQAGKGMNMNGGVLSTLSAAFNCYVTGSAMNNNGLNLSMGSVNNGGFAISTYNSIANSAVTLPATGTYYVSVTVNSPGSAGQQTQSVSIKNATTGTVWATASEWIKSGDGMTGVSCSTIIVATASDQIIFPQTNMNNQNNQQITIFRLF